MKLRRFAMPVVIMLLICATYSVAQKKQPPLPECKLTQAPEFNGFRLGMLLPEVKDALADTSMFDAKISGGNTVGTLAIRISGAELKDQYAEGIDDISLTFVDKRLAVVRATFYSGAGPWLGAQDFFKQFAEKLGLPAPAAENLSGGRGGEKYKVECPKFNVTLAYSFGVSPSVTIADAVAQKLIEERREKNPEGEIKDIKIKPGRPPRPNQPR
jgi:hypothetical protein